MRPVPSVPRTVDNKYRIEQLLGRGGMGAVYRARDMRLDRLVALKVVRAELLGDPEAQAAVPARGADRRAAAASVDRRRLRLRHVSRRRRLSDHGARQGRGSPARAPARGPAGDRRVDADPDGGVRGDRRRAPRRRAASRPEAGEHPAAGAAAAPAKVLDFGVAKLVLDDDRPTTGERQRTEAHTALTAAGMIIGTPAYMAPEQFHAVEADARTDVFSLGVVAYEMLSGDLPFGRGTLADVVLAQSRGVPPMPPDLVPARGRTRHPVGARRRSGSPARHAAGVRDHAVGGARSRSLIQSRSRARIAQIALYTGRGSRGLFRRVSGSRGLWVEVIACLN